MADQRRGLIDRAHGQGWQMGHANGSLRWLAWHGTGLVITEDIPATTASPEVSRLRARHGRRPAGTKATS